VSSVVVADGGNAGTNGAGGTGGVGTLIGGNGGGGIAKGATGGKGGGITFTATSGNITVGALLESLGGNGGAGFDGGAGGNGGTVNAGEAGGNGITGGAGGIGGAAGTITISSTGQIDLTADVRIGGGLFGGGTGGAGGKGGNGGQGFAGGNPGTGGVGGLGGAAGTLTVKAGSGTTAATADIEAQGGTGGAGGDGGAAGNITGGGGIDGGTGGNGGNGGKGGKVVVTGTNFLAPQPTFTGGDFGSGGAGGSGSGTGGTGDPGDPGVTGPSGPTPITMEDSEDAEWNSSKRSKQRRIARANPHFKPVALIQPMLQFSDRAVSAANVMMVSESKDLRAKVGSARVFVAKGSAAFVVNNGRDIAILSLHEGKCGDVSVLVGEQEINLRAGEQVVVTGSTDAPWGDVSPLPQLSIRGSVEHKLANGNRVLVSEFSIPGAISSLRAIQDLSNSTKEFERAAFQRILKNAAVLQTLMIKKGPFRPLQRQLITANAGSRP
jgi:hypothetical protein